MKTYRITIMVADKTNELTLSAAKLFFNGRQFNWGGTGFETYVVEGWEFKSDGNESKNQNPK